MKCDCSQGSNVEIDAEANVEAAMGGGLSSE